MTPSGAGALLEFAHDSLKRSITMNKMRFEDIPARGRGEEGWGARGGDDYERTVVYAWRVGNIVLYAEFECQGGRPCKDRDAVARAARAYADAIDARTETTSG